MSRELFTMRVQIKSDEKDPHFVRIFVHQLFGFDEKTNELILQDGQRVAIIDKWETIQAKAGKYGVIRELKDV